MSHCRFIKTNALSICPDKIIFVQDKIKIVPDKIIFVLDKKIFPRMKSHGLVVNYRRAQNSTYGYYISPM